MPQMLRRGAGGGERSIPQMSAISAEKERERKRDGGEQRWKNRTRNRINMLYFTSKTLFISNISDFIIVPWVTCTPHGTRHTVQSGMDYYQQMKDAWHTDYFFVMCAAAAAQPGAVALKANNGSDHNNTTRKIWNIFCRIRTRMDGARRGFEVVCDDSSFNLARCK